MIDLLKNDDSTKSVAKKLLAFLRERDPTARLADAYTALAISYGHTSWHSMSAQLKKCQDKFASPDPRVGKQRSLKQSIFTQADGPGLYFIAAPAGSMRTDATYSYFRESVEQGHNGIFWLSRNADRVLEATDLGRSFIVQGNLAEASEFYSLFKEFLFRYHGETSEGAPDTCFGSASLKYPILIINDGDFFIERMRDYSLPEPIVKLFKEMICLARTGKAMVVFLVDGKTIKTTNLFSPRSSSAAEIFSKEEAYLLRTGWFNFVDAMYFFPHLRPLLSTGSADKLLGAFIACRGEHPHANGVFIARGNEVLLPLLTILIWLRDHRSIKLSMSMISDILADCTALRSVASGGSLLGYRLDDLACIEDLRISLGQYLDAVRDEKQHGFTVMSLHRTLSAERSII